MEERKVSGKEMLTKQLEMLCELSKWLYGGFINDINDETFEWIIRVNQEICRVAEIIMRTEEQNLTLLPDIS